jgi:hypothetical protein
MEEDPNETKIDPALHDPDMIENPPLYEDQDLQNTYGATPKDPKNRRI